MPRIAVSVQAAPASPPGTRARPDRGLEQGRHRRGQEPRGL